MSLYLDPATHGANPNKDERFALIDEVLTTLKFNQLSGILGGVPFVKIVVDRDSNNAVHFLNDRHYHLHAYYVCDHITHEPRESFVKKIDQFNESVYHADNRRFYFASLGRIQLEHRTLYVLESQEVDSMKQAMIQDLYSLIKTKLDPALELLFKPANHIQETALTEIPQSKIPRIFTSEIYSNSNFVALNPAQSEGRIRYFKNPEDFRTSLDTIEWYDIVVMNRVLDEVPRVAGMINAEFTTPLSHTNVLAAGWKIPNCIQRNIAEVIQTKKLDHQWVKYSVTLEGSEAKLTLISEPTTLVKPNWVTQKINIGVPDAEDLKILPLASLKMSDRDKYGTKAANLGEMKNVLQHGSERILGFYQVKRPPRENLLSHLAHFLKVDEKDDLIKSANKFLSAFLHVPKGIVLPFSMQRRFLESSPQIQQAIGKLKLAIELDAHEIDALCITLQQLILKTKIPEPIRNEIDRMIFKELAGVKSFVLRSSSNAEDLENFSAAGIYESVNHVSSAETIFEGIKRVWASLVSSRSVRLRQQACISLDDSYMGVIIQEEVELGMGGVMVTKNPIDQTDFRNVYINVSLKSVINIVQGSELPLQYLYNSVEGGGSTLSLGGAEHDLPTERLEELQKIAFAGRLLQSHFSPDYTFSQPVDIEWLANSSGVYFLQLRPYAR